MKPVRYLSVVAILENRIFYLIVNIPDRIRTRNKSLRRTLLYSIELRGYIAGHNGIEPISAESESSVLPLHQCPITPEIGISDAVQ